MSSSSAALVLADKVALEGGAGLVAAQRVELNKGMAGLVAGQEVRGDQMRTVLLVAGRVEGEVQTSLDTQQTILAGLIAGLVAGAILLLFRRD
ncbi:MAG TPA: hypothetical protein VGA61_16485 [Anaerolineae bacterium]